MPIHLYILSGLEGFTKKYGLAFVEDGLHGRRLKLRDSANEYAQICASNSIIRDPNRII